jgi:DNA/RNA endonuclease YhcR with UshA esterase domain
VGLGVKAMKALIAIAIVLGLTSSRVNAQEAKADAGTATPKKISAAEAEKHYQETVIVTGKVAQVTIRPALVYLNLDKKYPETPMYCVVFARATNQFGDLKKLEGKQVEIKGRIEEFRDKAQIILNSTNQLKVIEKGADAAAPKKD